MKGVVGRQLLWPCLPPGVNRESSLYNLKFVKVMGYSASSSLYRLSFRTGNVFDLTPEDVDKSTDRDEAIRELEPVTVDFKLVNLPLVRFKQIDINNASLELGKYIQKSRVSVSYNSDGLSDTTDEDASKAKPKLVPTAAKTQVRPIHVYPSHFTNNYKP